VTEAENIRWVARIMPMVAPRDPGRYSPISNRNETNRRVPLRFGFPAASPELQADRLAVGTRLLLMSVSS